MSGHYWRLWNRTLHQFGVSYADTAEEAADNLGWAPSDCAVRSMAFPAPGAALCYDGYEVCCAGMDPLRPAQSGRKDRPR